jgi:biotin carboxylase
MDQEAVLAAATEEQVDGVLGNNDPAMPVVSFVSEKLGLVGNKKCSIDILVSKSGFRELQERAGVYCPKHFETDDISEIMDRIEVFDDPIVIKPSLSAGSQGTTKAHKDQAGIIKDAFEICKDLSRNGKVTVEEYVEMPSLEVIEGDFFVIGDEILWDGIFTTCRSEKAPMLPMTYIFPAILTCEQFATIKKNVEKIFREAGIGYGQYNVEMYFTAQGELFIIEVNPRQGGHLIPQWILKHTGVDYTKLLVTTAVGDTDYLNKIKNQKPPQVCYHTHHVVFSDQSGVFEKMEINPAIEKYVTDVDYQKQSGDLVNPRTIARDRTIAYVTLEFPDRETQLAYDGVALEAMIRPIVKHMED